MAKFPRHPKLSRAETEVIIMDLCEAIASTKDSKEAAQLLTDLLGHQELEMIARRLKIAELLLEEQTYENISKILKVSTTTIARVHTWLQEAGEGYRTVIERTKSRRRDLHKSDRPMKLSSIKRKYPLYFWPQIMLEEWLKHSTKKHKQEMRAVLNKLGAKRYLYKELDLLLRGGYEKRKIL